MEMVSCCGIMCGECPVYIATARGDEAVKRYLAAEYSFDGVKFYPEDIVCLGCLTVSADHNKFGRSCEIRKCCKERRIRLCAECKDFPCGKTRELVPSDSEQYARLEEMHRACENLL